MALFDLKLQIQLDEFDYTDDKIERLELACGKWFLSTGGEKSTAELVDHVHLQQDDYVLDVGCGLGGSALFMAQNFKVNVLAVDLSAHMLSRAKSNLAERCKSLKAKVEFQFMDITRKEFLPLSFDFIYCRETLFHVKDKEALFLKFFHWLKPGGKLLVCEYCMGRKDEKKSSPGFLKWMRDGQYYLESFDNFEKLIPKLGFQIVEAEDKTLHYIAYLKEELSRLQKERNENNVLKTFNNDEKSRYDQLILEWKTKIQRCVDGDQTWGFFIARKP